LPTSLLSNYLINHLHAIVTHWAFNYQLWERGVLSLPEMPVCILSYTYK
jgi:hypothetical protein